MSFSTQNFTGSVSGAQASRSTTGTFSASVTGNADGTLSGTWTFNGTYADTNPAVGISGSKTLTGTFVSGTLPANGPWTVTMGGSGISEVANLTYSNGQYSLSITNFDYEVAYTVNTGYDTEYTYYDKFTFNVLQSVSGAAPTTGTATVTGTEGPDDLIGGTSDDLITGLGSNDTLTGSSGNDTLSGGVGDDTMDGGTGTDVAVFAATRGTFTIVGSGGEYHVNHVPGAQGEDLVTNFERLQFTDRSVNLTVGATAHTITSAQLNSIIELYIAYIARVPDADGMAYWIGQLKAGQTLGQIGESFYSAAVQFSSITGYSASMTNGDFVTLVYRNVLGRDTPDAEGLAYWSGALAGGTETRGTLVSSMLTSAHSFKGRSDFGYVADLLDNKIAVGKTFAINQGLVYNTSEDSITQGMAIAAAVTPTSTNAAVQLIGVFDGFSLY